MYAMLCFDFYLEAQKIDFSISLLAVAAKPPRSNYARQHSAAFVCVTSQVEHISIESRLVLIVVYTNATFHHQLVCHNTSLYAECY
jgi:hypothetical protein